MAIKKSYLVIAVFLIFWILFISWGMFKTTFKLVQDKNKPAGQGGGISQQETGTPAQTPPGPTDQEPKPETTMTQVRTLRVKAANFTDILPVMGTVKGEKEMALRFEINGLIKKIYFREGQRVKPGDVIACIDPKDLELKATYGKNKYNSALAAYKSNLKKLEIHRKLYETGAIIKSKLEEVELECESAKYQAETAKSEMELAENELTKTCIRASKDGVIGPREAEEGEFVTPQDKVIALYEIHSVFVEVGVVERDIEKIKLGQKAKIYVDAFPSRAFDGKVENIFPVVEGKSRTLTVKLKVSNPEETLLPGMFSRSEILLAELKNAIIVPSTALAQTGFETVLIPVIPKATLGKDAEGADTGILELHRAKLGYITTDYAQVLSGLNQDDLVVLEAQGELKDNHRVKIVGIEELSL